MTKKPAIGKYYDADEQALIESIVCQTNPVAHHGLFGIQLSIFCNPGIILNDVCVFISFNPKQGIASWFPTIMQYNKLNY